jgi:hypothetical protein
VRLEGKSREEKEEKGGFPYHRSVGLWLGDWAEREERKRGDVQVCEVGLWGFNLRKSMFGFWLRVYYVGDVKPARSGVLPCVVGRNPDACFGVRQKQKSRESQGG